MLLPDQFSFPLPTAVQVMAAVARWNKSTPGASMVFTGSMSVCAIDDGSTVRV